MPPRFPSSQFLYTIIAHFRFPRKGDISKFLIFSPSPLSMIFQPCRARPTPPITPSTRRLSERAALAVRNAPVTRRMGGAFAPNKRGARDCAPYPCCAVGLVGRAVPCPPSKQGGRDSAPYPSAPKGLSKTLSFKKSGQVVAKPFSVALAKLFVAPRSL